MKSFCIKNNNKIILNYLLTEFENIDMDEIYITKNEFAHYKNVIIHYKGEKIENFILEISNVITNCILKFYENNIARNIIKLDYFYFDDYEKDIILENCQEVLNKKDTEEFCLRREKILINLYEYISEHKYFILDGFVNFRIFEYKNLIEETIDMAVNAFIIDREYKEFIKLLQDFIKTQPSKIDLVHLIYSKFEPIILDKNKEVILYEKRVIQPRYLSDISFSPNDYCLNELLNLLPQRLILHIIGQEDEFTNTLKHIFKDRILICRECNICKTFESIGSGEGDNIPKVDYSN